MSANTGWIAEIGLKANVREYIFKEMINMVTKVTRAKMDMKVEDIMIKNIKLRKMTTQVLSSKTQKISIRERTKRALLTKMAIRRHLLTITVPQIIIRQPDTLN